MEEDNAEFKAQQKDKDLAIIKAAFENGKIEKMSDLEKLSSTKIAALAGINQGRYGAKLFHPDKFTPSEIIRISLVLDVDDSYIMKVIRKQLIKAEVERVEKHRTKYYSKKKA
ncbi:hypothetical protein SAMN05216464_11870 [Mucilaginibacter pineti]|uniref:Uncharacterized protein n=1 Tax=Mucilaginibacter pineti TaxID=1391627 RepID=A0A1G7L7Y8_9SPHI|nr:hypothetical protein [Mucilaginibacter pineti]SDF45555.1 hypothetical protein SAMN05216464_11870 [Mucilaginibacter pineti]